MLFKNNKDLVQEEEGKAQEGRERERQRERRLGGGQPQYHVKNYRTSYF